MARFFKVLKAALFALLVVSEGYTCQVVLTRESMKQMLGGITEQQLVETKYITLSFKSIVSIDPQTFNGLTGLVQLNLYGNQISTIDPQAFNGLTSLIYLNIEDK